MDGYVELGIVAGVHGIRGAILLRLYTDNFDLFCKGEELLLKGPESGARQYVIESVGPHKGKLLVRLKGIADRDAAKKLIGKPALIEKQRLPELEEGEYYWFDLIGLEVFENNGDRLGKLESIIETGSNDVYVVKDKRRETLVPALPWVILSVDVEASKMIVDLPEGL